ncbi:MAG: response regulator, partial [Caldilineaceae bacterium]|nr:response regulator [Caldilineaceae bacterium]
MNPLRIVLVDDHALVIEGLKSLIDQQEDMAVVHTMQNGDELIDFLSRHQEIDVAVVDIQMSYSGLDALAELRRRNHP